MTLILRWLIATAAVAVAVHVLPGIEYDGRATTLFVVALCLGLVNALVRPLLKALSCALITLTLGLFLLVINAAMLLLAAWLSRFLGYGFHVDGFWAALVGSLVISLVAWVISLVLGDARRRR
jgi:putative membrane protein